MGIYQVGIVRVGVILGRNFPRWEFYVWELSGGNHPGDMFPGGSFASTGFWGCFRVIKLAWKMLMVF